MKYQRLFEEGELLENVKKDCWLLIIELCKVNPFVTLIIFSFLVI